MRSSRNDPKARIGNGARHEQGRFNAGLVVIAGDDERRHPQFAHLRFQLIDGLPSHLIAASSQRGAQRRMFGELAIELIESLGILLFEATTNGAVGIVNDALLHPKVHETVGKFTAITQELLPAGGVRPMSRAH
ncbi:hypothetical protein D3C81_829630 [compost metagenome]